MWPWTLLTTGYKRLAVDLYPHTRTLAVTTFAIAVAFLQPLLRRRVFTSPQAPISSPVKLLFYNDLDRKSPTNTYFLLLAEQTYAAAQAACANFHEIILPVDSARVSPDLINVLRFEAFDQTFTSASEFWITSVSDGNSCLAIDENGHIAQKDCMRTLPVLCTQSATLSTTGAETRFQVTVQSQGLQITGYRNQKSFRFLGIPYADRPQRFSYPTAYSGSSRIWATQFSPHCVQSGAPLSREDCLFLNIWTPLIPGTPSPKTSSLKPVFFYIHGGAFTSGAGSDPSFDGGNPASRGEVVTVTVNYRLSTLGFLALDDGVANGNFGLADQILALDWVRNHIVDFGGDPARITILGQSAGAASVRALMASPKAIGKFAAAIPMSNLAGSNYATTYSQYYTIEEEVDIAAKKILQQTGCADEGDQLQCLRDYDAHNLVALTDVARYIVVDGTYVTATGLPLNGLGQVANVHTLMGLTRDDAAAFIGYPENEDLSRFLQQQGFPTTILDNSLFPMPHGDNAQLKIFNVSSRLATDLELRCLDQATTYSGVKHNLFKSAWFYEFNRTYQPIGYHPNAPNCDAPISPNHPHGDPFQEYFKCHSGEVYWIFGNLPSTSGRPYRDDFDLPFMQQIVDQWTSFARTFNPNPDPAFLEAKGFTSAAQQFAAMSRWDPVTMENINYGGGAVRQLDWPSYMMPFKDVEQCEFLGFPLTYFETDSLHIHLQV
ncbi:carboxylesterase from carbohydrate esterase [Panus rudis PR-1116 ss-1]|nr:carboxylesterase from carbohydrate esterase [Panus rudis PR-1116 ss-1]